jgi:hypothetical protein
VDKFVIVISEAGDVMCDVSVDTLGIAVILQIFMVCEDCDWVCGVCKEVSPGFQAVDYSEEFSVVDVIVSLSVRKSLGVEADCAQFTPDVCLGEYCSRGEGRCVDLQGEGFGAVGLF